MALQPALMQGTGFHRDDQHRQICEIAGQVVPEKRVIRNVQESNHRVKTFSSEFSVNATAWVSVLVCRTFRR